MKKLLILAAAGIALAGCQSETASPYRQATVAGQVGYISSPAENDRTTVIYTGAKGVPSKTVAQYALLRAAELTEQAGYEWFAVLGTETKKVTLVRETDLTDKGALTSGGASTSTSAQPSDSAGSDVGVALGPTTGGFGGGAVPYQVNERWVPPKGFQTTMLIQMGRGDNASFPGVTEQPQIFPANQTATEIRADMMP